MNKEIMIDLETLGINKKAPILSIGACSYDKDNIYSKFYVDLNWVKQIDSGVRLVDGNTIKWWLKQSDSARKAITKDDVISAKDGLLKFVEWYEGECKADTFGTDKSPVVWAKGPNFDIAMLESFFADYGTRVPWHYRNVNCVRTMERFHGKGLDLDFKGTEHNALDDAIHQAKEMQICMARAERK